MSDGSDPPHDEAPDDANGDGGRRKDYKVGYGKPPLHTRFRPGQSGNPRGKTPGAKGLKSELRAELSERVTVTQDGKTRRLSKRRVILKALAAKAAKGDVRAADKLISLIIQMEGFEDQRENRPTLSENDRQILDVLLGEDLPGRTNVEDVDRSHSGPTAEKTHDAHGQGDDQ